MTKKYTVLMLTLAIAILPALAQAAPLKKIIGTEKKVATQQKDLKNEVKDLRDGRQGTSTRSTSSGQAATSTATSTIEKRNEARVKVFQLAAGLVKNITREIAQVKNLIVRLTGTNSIVAKLDAKGVNTTAIKAKLTDASTLADKAQTELANAQNIIASSTANTASTSVQVLKNRALEARKALAAAHSDIKTAITDIKGARKLIAQIPGIKGIENGTSTTATTSTATSTR